MSTIANGFMKFLGGFMLLYMGVIIATYTSMLIFLFVAMFKEHKLDKNVLDEIYRQLYSKPLSIIIPAYNEEVGVVDSVHWY